MNSRVLKEDSVADGKAMQYKIVRNGISFERSNVCRFITKMPRKSNAYAVSLITTDYRNMNIDVGSDAKS